MRGGFVAALTLAVSTAVAGVGVPTASAVSRVGVPHSTLASSVVAPGVATSAGLTIGSRVVIGGRAVTGASPLPGDLVEVAGTLTTRTPRTVVLQRFAAGAWREVARGTFTVRWSLPVVAPVPGRYSYRALAPAVGSSSALTSADYQVQVVSATVSLAAAPSSDVGRLRRVTGSVTPGRPGRAVQLWELRETSAGVARWLPLAQTTQNARGRFVVQVPAGTAGTHRYRAAAADALGHFPFRSSSLAAVTARSADAAAYLSDVTPLITRVADDATPPAYQVTGIVVAGRTQERSMHTSAHQVAYDVQGFSNLSTSLSLLPVTAAVPHRGGRLVEVRVDGQLRLRRFLLDGQLVPLSLDVRGVSQVQLRSWDAGTVQRGPGSDLVLLTPVVSTVARPEVGVDADTGLSELPATSRSGPLSTGQVVGEPDTGLLGGSVTLRGSADAGTSGSVVIALGGRFTMLSAVPALGGRPCRCSGRIMLYGDEKLLTTLDATAGAPVRRTVDVTGVRSLRLLLVADRPEPATASSWTVNLADPRLT